MAATLVAEAEMSSTISGKERVRASALWTIGAFLFAFAWGVGGALDAPSKQMFSTFYRRLAYGRKTVKNFE